VYFLNCVVATTALSSYTPKVLFKSVNLQPGMVGSKWIRCKIIRILLFGEFESFKDM